MAASEADQEGACVPVPAARRAALAASRTSKRRGVGGARRRDRETESGETRSRRAGCPLKRGPSRTDGVDRAMSRASLRRKETYPVPHRPAGDEGGYPPASIPRMREEGAWGDDGKYGGRRRRTRRASTAGTAPTSVWCSGPRAVPPRVARSTARCITRRRDMEVALSGTAGPPAGGIGEHVMAASGQYRDPCHGTELSLPRAV